MNIEYLAITPSFAKTSGSAKMAKNGITDPRLIISATEDKTARKRSPINCFFLTLWKQPHNLNKLLFFILIIKTRVIYQIQ